MQTVANTIIANTSGSNESDDFWSRAELNLLMAMLHYVANLKDDRGNLLPIEQRGLGKIYEPQTAEDLPEQDFDIIGDASDAAVDNDLGMQECGADIVVGMDDPDLPPR